MSMCTYISTYAHTHAQINNYNNRDVKCQFK